jgi:protein SCO1
MRMLRPCQNHAELTRSDAPMTRLIAILSAATVVIGLGLGWFYVMRDPGGALTACGRSAVAGGEASMGGPFTLTNGAGDRVTEAEIVTQPTLLYFGYTFCPDFCPTDLVRNAAAKDILAGRGTDINVVFISFDPERDTPEVASDYAANIDPEAIGLSGSPEDIAAAASAYRVYYRKASEDPEFYLMDHSTFTYLAAPGHPFLEFYSTDASPDEVADSVACYAEAL